MAITVPVVDTEISVANFGKPVADQINAWIPTPWTGFTFQNSWGNYVGTGYEKGQYRKVGDIVYLRGLIVGGANASVATTLPTGFRPSGYAYLPCVGANTIPSPGYLLVFPNGEVRVYAAGNIADGIGINSQFSLTP